MDEYRRKSGLVFRVLTTDNPRKLPVINGYGLEKGRRSPVIRIFPYGEYRPAYSLVHVHERILGDRLRKAFDVRFRCFRDTDIIVLVLDHDMGNPSNILSMK